MDLRSMICRLGLKLGCRSQGDDGMISFDAYGQGARAARLLGEGRQ
ncbi:hypothetical protein [Paenibacillus odorifer]|nr:hypothetical protein [Paenibacillus odorifer]